MNTTTTGQVKQFRNQSQRELKILVHRVVALEEQYKQVLGSIKQTIRRTEQMEVVKQKHSDVQGERRAFMKQDDGFLQTKTNMVSQLNKAQQLEKQQVFNQIQQNKSEEYRQMKQQSEINKQRIDQQKQQQLQDKKLVRERVIIAGEESKQSLQNYWVNRMQGYDQDHKKERKNYLQESNQINLRTVQLERCEDDIIVRLQNSQILQNQAADRLTALFVKPWVDYQSNFQSEKQVTQGQKLPKVERKHRINRHSKTNSKLMMYNEPQTLLNPSSNKVVSIKPLPKLSEKLKFLSKKSTPIIYPARSRMSYTAQSQGSQKNRSDEQKLDSEEKAPNNQEIAEDTNQLKEQNQTSQKHTTIEIPLRAEESNERKLSQSIDYQLTPQLNEVSPNLDYSPDQDQEFKNDEPLEDEAIEI